jgi:DUF971 family protein
MAACEVELHRLFENYHSADSEIALFKVHHQPVRVINQDPPEPILCGKEEELNLLENATSEVSVVSINPPQNEGIRVSFQKVKDVDEVDWNLLDEDFVLAGW